MPEHLCQSIYALSLPQTVTHIGQKAFFKHALGVTCGSFGQGV